MSLESKFGIGKPGVKISQQIESGGGKKTPIEIVLAKRKKALDEYLEFQEELEHSEELVLLEDEDEDEEKK